MAGSKGLVDVGAGLAGASAVRELREGNFLGRIRLIGAEAHRPYIRPPLSKPRSTDRAGCLAAR